MRWAQRGADPRLEGLRIWRIQGFEDCGAVDDPHVAGLADTIGPMPPMSSSLLNKILDRFDEIPRPPSSWEELGAQRWGWGSILASRGPGSS
jgi:hypothetical protein